MKGFWHVVEAGIVAVVAFLVLMQFYSIPDIKTDWGKTRLVVQSRDILYSLDRSGINWFNASEVSERLRFAFNNSNVVYDLKIENAVRSDIKVACFCNDSEYAFISSALRPFVLNGRDIDFTVIKQEPSNVIFSELYDVIVLFDSPLKGYYSSMMSFLSSDKGIMLIRDLREEDFSEQSDGKELKGIFGLEWSSSPESASALVFSPAIEEGMLAYPVVRNFYAFPNSSGQRIESPHVFGNFISGERVVQKDGDMTRSVLVQQDSNHSALIVNAGVSNGLGRTAWLSGGPDTEDRRVLMKAVIAWLAGDTEHVIDEKMSKQLAVVPFIKLYNKDMFEPVEIVLTLGHRY